MFNVSTQYVESFAFEDTRENIVDLSAGATNCGMIALAITLTVGMHIYDSQIVYY